MGQAWDSEVPGMHRIQQVTLQAHSDSAALVWPCIRSTDCHPNTAYSESNKSGQQQASSRCTGAGSVTTPTRTSGQWRRALGPPLRTDSSCRHPRNARERGRPAAGGVEQTRAFPPACGAQGLCCRDAKNNCREQLQGLCRAALEVELGISKLACGKQGSATASKSCLRVRCLR